MEKPNNNGNITSPQSDREAWIAVRRNALYDYFNLPEKNKAEAEAVFDRMRALAAECPDQGVHKFFTARSGYEETFFLPDIGSCNDGFHDGSICCRTAYAALFHLPDQRGLGEA